MSLPTHIWSCYKSSASAGYSAEKLAEIDRFCDEIGTAALLIIHNGVILHARGEIERRFECRSIRKSFLSALYGIYWGRGLIDLEQTVEELGIDDVPSLTEAEKQATVQHLLTARSGVYHTAAYEGNIEKPPRGSHPPGGRWHYNNWDFNALYTIFERQTGQAVFESFDRDLALPLQMDHWRSTDRWAFYELERSQHPAYLFRMSAMDMARFGLLFLKGGVWQGKQIIPKDWIAQSTTSHSQPNEEGYGYMWWVPHRTGGLGRFAKMGMFEASGNGGQKITVLPAANLVVVHLCNTYHSTDFYFKHYWELLDLILAAQIESAVEKPEVVPFESDLRPSADNRVDERFAAPLVGEYTLEIGVKVMIKYTDGVLFLLMQPAHFPATILQPVAEAKFRLEEIGAAITFSVVDGSLDIALELPSGRTLVGTRSS